MELLQPPQGGKFLPIRYVHCKKCHGSLRCAKQGKDRWLICDHCNIAALAPSAHWSLIDDFLARNDQCP